eukprot:5766381-Pleurochrysis_carterae.AAC.1
MMCLTGADRLRICAFGHELERGAIKFRRQGMRACQRSLRAQRCAAPARSPRHNSSTAIL